MLILEVLARLRHIAETSSLRQFSQLENLTLSDKGGMATYESKIANTQMF